MPRTSRSGATTTTEIEATLGRESSGCNYNAGVKDQKYEQRPVLAFAHRREAAVRKFRDRMNSATHEISAQLAGYAWRRHFAQVRYDDSEHSYLGDGFPWYRLRILIAEKLDARGIALEVSAQPTQETPGPAGGGITAYD